MKKRFKKELGQLNDIYRFIELKTENIDSNCIDDIKLCVEEVFVNLVKYSNCSYIDLFINRIDSLIELTFMDDGIQFDPLAKENEILSDSLNRSKSGIGLYILENRMDSLDYQYLNGKNVFTMRKHI